MLRPTFLILALLFLPAQANAGGFKGSISFTQEEQETHAKDIDIILSAAAGCLKQDLDHHHEFYKKYGISPYYGDRSEFSKLSLKAKRAEIASLGADPNLVSQLEPTSCVGLAVKCLAKGFAAAHEETLWKRLKQYVWQNGVDGESLQDGLQKLGWKILYWNPDVRLNQSKDAAEKEKNPSNSDRFWGYHEENWQNARKNSRYLYNHVDDVRLLVNFGAEEPKATKEIPFFIGTAHMGYHVFPGSYGRIIEAHSVRKINDPKTLQSDPFNPLKNQAPTDGTYFSGLIVVPAKYAR